MLNNRAKLNKVSKVRLTEAGYSDEIITLVSDYFEAGYLIGAIEERKNILTTMQIKIKKLYKDALLPKRAHQTDAGCDLYAHNFHRDEYGNIVYGTGIAIEIPQGFVGLVFPRSSIHKYGLSLSNAVGVIDSGYRGEVMAKFRKAQPYGEEYKVGDRIAQLIIMPYPAVMFEEVAELSDSDRGQGGYGSSGQ